VTNQEVVDFLNDNNVKDKYVEIELAGYPGTYKGTFRGCIESRDYPMFNWVDGKAFWLTLDMGFELMEDIDMIQNIQFIE
jgi:hypothetical protein